MAAPTSIATLLGGDEINGCRDQASLCTPVNESDADDEDASVLVLVPGSSNFQAGFASDDAPSAIFPSKVGRCRHIGVMVGMGQKEAYVGDEAQSKRGILTIRHPIERGMFTNWDDARHLFHHALYGELRVAPEDCAVLVADTPCTPRADRERLCQTLFETFNVRHVHVTTRTMLALYASGRITGVAVHIGESAISVLPVLDGQGLAHALQTSEVGGRDVTDRLVEILTERGYCFVRAARHAPFPHIERAVRTKSWSEDACVTRTLPSIRCESA